MITRQHVCDTYGPLGGGPRLGSDVAGLVGKTIASAIPLFTEAATKVLAQHLHAISKRNLEKKAKEALMNLAADFGAEAHPVGTFDQGPGMAEMAEVVEGGGSLPEFIEKAKEVIKRIGHSAARYGKKAVSTIASQVPRLAKRLIGAGDVGASKKELEALACDMAEGGFSIRDVREMLSSLGSDPRLGKALEYGKAIRDSPFASMGYHLASDAIGRQMGIEKDTALEGATDRFLKRKAHEEARRSRRLEDYERRDERDFERRERELERRERELDLAARSIEDKPPKKRPQRRAAGSGIIVGGNVVGGAPRDKSGRFLSGAVLKSNLYDAFKA